MRVLKIAVKYNANLKVSFGIMFHITQFEDWFYYMIIIMLLTDYPRTAHS